MRTKTYLARVDALIETARTHEGYRARAQRVNQYGAQLGVDGMPWAGAFLESVMREAKELTQPSLVHTASALAAYVRAGREFRVPKVGDLVFYAFSTDGQFTQPHIGLVTDVSNWKTEASFKAIEGQTDSGLSKGPKDADGVYERRRYSTDVLAFVRPKYEDLRASGPMSETKIHPSTVQPFKRVSSKNLVAIQKALAETVGAQGMSKGFFDPSTRSAIKAYQRRIGAPDNGMIDAAFLSRLALDTNFVHFTPDIS